MGHHLRILTAYRPVPSKGTLSTYQQHVHTLTEHKQEVDPRKAILTDLQELLQQWINNGEYIIAGMDANEDIRNPMIRNFFRNLGMDEIILNRHSVREVIATYNRNEYGIPIDGIWPTALI